MPKRPEHRAPTLPLDVDDPAPETTLATPLAAPEDPAAGEDSIARFEQDLAELDAIVTRMEQGELRLEESLSLFERGMALSQACRRSLDQAELKVRTLTERDTGEDA